VASTGDSGVPEARIAQLDEGAVVETDGWFVLNLATPVRADWPPET
jgi:hypothetical protein